MKTLWNVRNTVKRRAGNFLNYQKPRRNLFFGYNHQFFSLCVSEECFHIMVWWTGWLEWELIWILPAITVRCTISQWFGAGKNFWGHLGAIRLSYWVVDAVWSRKHLNVCAGRCELLQGQSVVSTCDKPLGQEATVPLVPGAELGAAAANIAITAVSQENFLSLMVVFK